MISVLSAWRQRWKLYRSRHTKKWTRIEQKRGRLLARLVSVYDGDTFTVAMVQDGNVYSRRCRCIGYDSPEMKGGTDREGAIRARDYLKQIIPGGTFTLHYEGYDKYGRLLVKFRVRNEWLAEHMIRMGHGYAYHGGTKHTPTNIDAKL